MRARLLPLICLGLALSWVSPGRAAPDKSRSRGKKRAIQKHPGPCPKGTHRVGDTCVDKVTRMSFDGDQIEGETTGPGVEWIEVKKRPNFECDKASDNKGFLECIRDRYLHSCSVSSVSRPVFALERVDAWRSGENLTGLYGSDLYSDEWDPDRRVNGRAFGLLAGSVFPIDGVRPAAQRVTIPGVHSIRHAIRSVRGRLVVADDVGKIYIIKDMAHPGSSIVNRFNVRGLNILGLLPSEAAVLRAPRYAKNPGYYVLDLNTGDFAKLEVSPSDNLRLLPGQGRRGQLLLQNQRTSELIVLEVNGKRLGRTTRRVLSSRFAMSPSGFVVGAEKGGKTVSVHLANGAYIYEFEVEDPIDAFVPLDDSVAVLHEKQRTIKIYYFDGLEKASRVLENYEYPHDRESCRSLQLSARQSKKGERLELFCDKSFMGSDVPFVDEPGHEHVSFALSRKRRGTYTQVLNGLCPDLFEYVGRRLKMPQPRVHRHKK